tara:strand:+ start:2179 stop:2778 length:600 start_codon:yes stop_codon:yes gene_type:complete
MSNHNIQKIGIILSYLIHPMVISFVTFLYLIYYSNILIENKNLIFVLCFIFSTISPIGTFYFLKKNSLISDLDASKKEERLLPMAFGALFFLLGFITLKTLNIQLLIQGVMFCGMINVILAWLITNYWKISIHAITLSSSITIFWILGYQNVLITILILFVLIIGRLLAQAHDLNQIMAGILLGIISTFTCYTVLFLQQ